MLRADRVYASGATIARALDPEYAADATELKGEVTLK
jgi:hypothetical protein